MGRKHLESDCVFVPVSSKALFSSGRSDVCITGLHPQAYLYCLPFFQMTRDHPAPLGAVPCSFFAGAAACLTPAHGFRFPPTPFSELARPLPAPGSRLTPLRLSLGPFLKLILFLFFFSYLRNDSPPSFSPC